MPGEESMMDIMERMESLVPEYSYESVSDIVRTDGMVRDFLISKMKEIKDCMFHVVQISYELQRDRLSESAESAWNELDSLLDRVENSGVSGMKGRKKYCRECKERIQKNIGNLIRRDRELVLAAKNMRRVAQLLYRELLDKGSEARFISGVNTIKRCADEMTGLLEERDRSIRGSVA